MRSFTDGNSSTASEANEVSVGTADLVEGERRGEAAAARMASSSFRLRLSLTRSDKLLTVKNFN